MMEANDINGLNANNHAITVTTRIAVVSASLVILSAGILGYTALFDLFLAIGLFHWSLAIFFPLLFDLAEVTAAVAVFNARLQGEDDKFAWRMVIIFTALGVIANCVHAGHAYYIGKIDQGQVVLAIFATSLFPLSVALVTHLLKRVISRSITRQQVAVTLVALMNEIETKRTMVTDLTAQVNALTDKAKNLKTEPARLQQEKRQHDDKRPKGAQISAATIDKARSILRKRVDNGEKFPSGAELGRLLGVSKTSGNKVKKMLVTEFASVNPNGNQGNMSNETIQIDAFNNDLEFKSKL
jgi:hypothetical protein